MAVCPNGHDSAGDDFCEVCGFRIVGPPGAPQSAGSAPISASGSSSAMAGPETLLAADTGEPCPICGTARSGQFCEACGYNFAAPQPASSPAPPSPPVPSPYAPAVWTAVVSSDRDHYERVRAASGSDWTEVPFPAYCAERRFRLTGNQMRIGRRSVSRGLDPEIDLTGPPEDAGISRLHAVLISGPDGSWAVLDPGSANGTLVNGNEIPAESPVPLHDGDRINVGAWTVITVQRG